MLSDANVPDHHIMFVSGHSSEQSLAHYTSRPSVTQLESVSDTISNAVENNQPQTTEISKAPLALTKAPLIQSSNQMSSNVSLSTNTASFPNGLFNACNIQGNVQVFFGSQSGSQSHSGDKIWVAISIILYYIFKFCRSILLSLRFSIPRQVTLDSSLKWRDFP